MVGNFFSGHVYDEPGTYNVSADMECLCGLFSLSSTTTSISVQCSDTARIAFHVAQFQPNNVLPIYKIPPTVIVGGVNIKIRANNSVFQEPQIVTGIQAYWNNYGMSYSFQTVDQFYFGNDVLEIFDIALPATSPVGGQAELGGRKMWFAIHADNNVFAHEFGHILGFPDTYIENPDGTGSHRACFEADIMTMRDPLSIVQIYHSTVLTLEY